MQKFILKSQSRCTLDPDVTGRSLLTPFLLSSLSAFLTKNHFTWENPLQGDASRSLHLAVIYYVPNEQMKCLITVL